MSIRQLIPSLGKELDQLCARLAHLEGMLGVGRPVAPSGTNAQRFCGWAYCNGTCKVQNSIEMPSAPYPRGGVSSCTSQIPSNRPHLPSSINHGLKGRTPTFAPTGSAAFPTRIFRQSKSLPRSYQAPTPATKPQCVGIPEIWKDFSPRSRSPRRNSYCYNSGSSGRDITRRSYSPPPISNPRPQVESPSLSSAGVSILSKN